MSEVVIIPREKQPEPETPKVPTKEDIMAKLAAKFVGGRAKKETVK